MLGCYEHAKEILRFIKCEQIPSARIKYSIQVLQFGVTMEFNYTYCNCSWDDFTTLEHISYLILINQAINNPNRAEYKRACTCSLPNSATRNVQKFYCDEDESIVIIHKSMILYQFTQVTPQKYTTHSPQNHTSWGMLRLSFTVFRWWFYLRVAERSGGDVCCRLFEETHCFRLQDTDDSKICKFETEVPPKRREYSSRPHGTNNQKKDQQRRCFHTKYEE